jgi:hypothetical protein
MAEKYTVILDTFSRDIFGMKRSDSLATGICVCCHQEERHYSEQGYREFQISGLCEFCFDEIAQGRVEAESTWRMKEIPETEWPPEIKPLVPRRDKDD